MNTIQILKPKCPTCDRVSVESQDRICPTDRIWMPLSLVEIEV